MIYVDYETASRLKKLGFNESVDMLYVDGNLMTQEEAVVYTDLFDPYDVQPAPLQEVADKWLKNKM